MGSNYETTETIYSINDYINFVQEIKNKWDKEHTRPNYPYIWFRGQGQDYPLKPSIFREQIDPYTNETLNFRELYIVNKFKALYKNYTSHRLDSKLELFSYMQHYGIPTRLLDWTEGSLNALFFALCDLTNRNEDDPVVYIMHSGKLNNYSIGNTGGGPFLAELSIVQARLDLIGFEKNIIGKFFEKYQYSDKLSIDHINYPISIFPESSYNRRIASQKGCFTLHGLSNISIEDFFIKKNITDFLAKIKISTDSVDSIYKELKTLGISYRSLFPDMEGLALELKDRLNR